MAYNYYRETDPLLPNNKGAPEIQSSRPQSINNEYILEEQASDEEKEPTSFVETIIRPIALIFVAAFLLALLDFGIDGLGRFFDGDDRPAPKNLDERVTRILEDTPLIGRCDPPLGVYIF